jgi:phosphoenolpyruvate carboxylase
MAGRSVATPAPSRAEPRGIGTGRAGNVLAREVRLLGSLLGQVIVEQAGPAMFDLVESTRRRAITARRSETVARLDLDVAALDPASLEGVVRAFGLYFQLVNLAEQRDVVRQRARLARATRGASETGPLRDALAAQGARGDIQQALARLSIVPVLTAHPTEARRRTVLVALRRITTLLERLDDPRLTPATDQELRRRLREEIALLWQTAEIRRGALTPLDEVRTAMVFFDETIYRLAPRLYRSVERALAPGRGGEPALAPPTTRAFLRFGSWIGGDRDGHPDVTADVTDQALRIQADHVLRGHQAVATRLMQVLAAKLHADAVPEPLARRLEADAGDFPTLARSLAERYPAEPFRQRFGFIAERLGRTRRRLAGDHRVGDVSNRETSTGASTGAYEGTAELLRDLEELQQALVAVGLSRSAWGEVQDFRWQVETFGFHLAELEVRQHASVHRHRIAGGAPATAMDSEVDATFRVVASLQDRFGQDAVHRVVVSFTERTSDVTDVLALADRAAPGGSSGLDVVPLFESLAALSQAGEILDTLLAEPTYREHVRRRGDRQEVMLGYSDSNKEVGYFSANWRLHEAQASLVEAAERHGVELTLFHGRGGPVGRGGGALERAVLGQPSGSVDLRLKLTEQGEVIASRYSDPEIGLAHLEGLTAATLAASAPAHRANVAAWTAEGGAILDELSGVAQRAYRTLVYDDPDFAGFFGRITPIDEVATLRLGSRPAARAGGGSSRDRRDRSTPSIERLRAIPWVFAWSQARIELPGWYGLGSALAAWSTKHQDPELDGLSALYRGWPFLTGVVDHARTAIERADLPIARGYAALATEPGDVDRWRAIEAEHETTRTLLSRLTGDAARKVDARGWSPSSAALRAPYVDALSVAQLGILRELRRLERTEPDNPRVQQLRWLVRLTISGLAAGLQGTG